MTNKEDTDSQKKERFSTPMSPTQLINKPEVTVPESVTNRNNMVSATHNLSIYSKKEIEYLKKTHEQNNLTLLKQHWRKGEVKE